MMLTYSMFAFPVYPSDTVEVTPSIAPGPSVPWVVRISEDRSGTFGGHSWIPFQVIVWARDPIAAIERCITGLLTVEAGSKEYDKHARLSGHYDRWGGEAHARYSKAVHILDKMRAGLMTIDVEQYDTTMITECGPWASNGGVR